MTPSSSNLHAKTLDKSGVVLTAKICINIAPFFFLFFFFGGGGGGPVCILDTSLHMQND